MLSRLAIVKEKEGTEEERRQQGLIEFHSSRGVLVREYPTPRTVQSQFPAPEQREHPQHSNFPPKVPSVDDLVEHCPVTFSPTCGPSLH